MSDAAGLVTVPVELAERSYDVLVGPGAVEALAEVLPERARRAAVVTQAGHRRRGRSRGSSTAPS